MVDPKREPLAGLVEVDETSLPFRGKDAPAAAEIIGKSPRAGSGWRSPPDPRSRRDGQSASPTPAGRHADHTAPRGGPR